MFRCALILVCLPLLSAIQITCLPNVTFSSSDVSITFPISSLNECFCLGSSSIYAGLNYFPNNHTCQWFYNFTSNYHLIRNVTGHFCFLRPPPSVPISMARTTNSIPTTTAGPLRWNSTGVTVATGAGNSAILSPFGVFVDDQNFIYIADKNTSRVSKWSQNSTGASTSLILQTNPGELNAPPSLYVDSRTGTIYVADETNRRVRSFTNGSTTGQNVISTTVGSSPNVNAIYLDPNGAIFVTDTTNNRIYNWLTNATAAGGNGAGLGANQLNGPRRFFIDEDFSFYIADFTNARIQRWRNGSATSQTVAGGNGPGNGTNQLLNPLGVVVSSGGDVIVCDSGNHRIQLWRPSATVGETIAGSPAGVSGSTATLLNGPRGIAIDKQDNIYVADAGNLRIQKFNVL